MRKFEPTQRNRNIGTRKRGHGQNNRMTIPEYAHGEHRFWERVDGARLVTRTIRGRPLKFFGEPSRSDCVHPCTAGDVARLLMHVPAGDWEGIGAILFRQPRRKEQILDPVWGRLAYAADLVGRGGRLLYSGPAIVLEAVDPTAPIKFGTSLSAACLDELNRLREDGHKISPDRHHTIQSTLESCRATQLYRTFLHELGHWVDFLEKVEGPASGSPSGLLSYEKLADRFHSRPNSEKEHFAHAYADQMRRALIAKKAIPFDRQLEAESTG